MLITVTLMTPILTFLDGAANQVRFRNTQKVPSKFDAIQNHIEDASKPRLI